MRDRLRCGSARSSTGTWTRRTGFSGGVRHLPGPRNRKDSPCVGLEAMSATSAARSRAAAELLCEPFDVVALPRLSGKLSPALLTGPWRPR